MNMTNSLEKRIRRLEEFYGVRPKSPLPPLNRPRKTIDTQSVKDQ